MTNGSGDHGGSGENREAKKDELRKDSKATSVPKEAPPVRPKSN
jgi:hypothetical protein